MFREKLKEYVDAKVPIIYINSYDDNAVEKCILEVTRRRKVWEWNQMYGLRNRKDIEKKGYREVKEMLSKDITIEDFLIDGVRDGEFERKVIILKDSAVYLENPKIIALLKNACLSIENGDLDTVFVIISPVLKIPKELEKYITILQEDYLT